MLFEQEKYLQYLSMKTKNFLRAMYKCKCISKALEVTEVLLSNIKSKLPKILNLYYLCFRLKSTKYINMCCLRYAMTYSASIKGDCNISNMLSNIGI